MEQARLIASERSLQIFVRDQLLMTIPTRVWEAHGSSRGRMRWTSRARTPAEMRALRATLRDILSESSTVELRRRLLHALSQTPRDARIAR